MDENRLLFIVKSTKAAFVAMLDKLEAGMTPAVAYETALREIDYAYQQACLLENVQPQNTNLDPPIVELQARFALDALFGAQAGDCNESEARKAFWLSFWKVTRPSLKLMSSAVLDAQRKG